MSNVAYFGESEMADILGRLSKIEATLRVVRSATIKPTNVEDWAVTKTIESCCDELENVYGILDDISNFRMMDNYTESVEE